MTHLGGGANLCLIIKQVSARHEKGMVTVTEFGAWKCHLNPSSMIAPPQTNVWCGLINIMMGLLFFHEQITICMVAVGADVAFTVPLIDGHLGLVF
jgi:hypothetical protein